MSQESGIKIKTFIIAAQTADGFIAHDSSESSFTWTSGADKKHFADVTKKAGVIVVGSKTFETFGKPLKERLNIVYSKSSKTYPGTETTALSPKELLESLEKRGFKEVAICGGASIYSFFLKEKAVDELYLTVEPKLFGSGVKLVDSSLDINLELLSSQQLAINTIVLHYKVIK